MTMSFPVIAFVPFFKLIFSCQIIHFFELALEFIIIQDYINYLIRKNSNWNNIYF